MKKLSPDNARKIGRTRHHLPESFPPPPKNTRSTRVRRFIMEIFKNSSSPLSVGDILGILGSHGLKPNKTTIYRSLAAWKNLHLIKEIYLSDGKNRYELISRGHHHHIVCLDCEKVEDVVLKNDLKAEEKNILRNKSFQILNHALEFYGICKGCSSNYKF